MTMKIVILCLSFLFFGFAQGMMKGLYCGEENCYDVLGLTRDATKVEISKAYRSLARKWHPDMHKKDKESAADMFRDIATAYETLKDDESRKDYDYMLDHPEEFYSHYYRYYSKRVAPKVDVRIVLVVTITAISIVQYLSALNNYNSAINYFTTIPKYRIQALQYCKQEGISLPSECAKKKKDKSKTKEEVKEEDENLIKSVIKEKLDIRGGYSKPTIYDTAWLQLLFLPYHVTNYVVWSLRWFWRYKVQGKEYSDEDKKYIIRKFLNLSQTKWESLEDEEKEDFLERELWKKENFDVYKKSKEDEMKEQLAENARYKQYRRYLKKGGPGQMSFGPE